MNYVMFCDNNKNNSLKSLINLEKLVKHNKILIELANYVKDLHHLFQNLFISFIQIKQFQRHNFFWEQTIGRIYYLQAKDIRHDMCPLNFTLVKTYP